MTSYLFIYLDNELVSRLNLSIHIIKRRRLPVLVQS